MQSPVGTLLDALYQSYLYTRQQALENITEQDVFVKHKFQYNSDFFKNLTLMFDLDLSIKENTHVKY